MTYEEFNQFCAGLTATSYVMQWGNSHVWKVGGKVFAIGGWSDKTPAFTFKTSDNNFEFLSRHEDYRPAPYFATRGMKWIQCLHSEDNGEELKYYLQESHRIVAAGLSKKKQKELGLLL